VITAEPLRHAPHPLAAEGRGRAFAGLVLGVAGLWLSVGCAARNSRPPAAPNAVSAPSTAPTVPAAQAVIEAPPTAASSDTCGPFECRWFDTGSAALEFVLAEAPLALGVGEAHALAGSERIESSARRFTESLLPELRGRASHLVVELLAPDPRCEQATGEVRRAQEPVTRAQSAQNQNDYVELGRRAREIGIEPFVLRPSCEEYRAIAAAGPDAIDRMLSTIARVTSRMLRAALVKNQAAGRAALVIGYGGALHNDIEPPPAKADWSYGPELAAFTGGRYAELDLIVREFIKDTETWRALPWYAHFDPSRDSERWLVMRTAAHRYALFFPRAAASPAQGSDLTPPTPP
jgi:hypothetical protein